ncbi:hypothetical protein EYC98_03310 [Halieaceae bacterium IMCC14734]|uniref:Uncharacterized protein n=1 Tax=Candidatus Litorirhabdus singularis TaxID=2518993 RepID=A0ABT3TC68_9GAMM|nr:hypothetical protein [Candidatus Litorirhabdus singularis]MCX2979888.1 hypothetical protein [Candidatus Litorirhabdus singularis]
MLTKGFTDFAVFASDVSSESPEAQSTIAAIIETLKEFGQVGQIELKQWDAYEEIPRETLSDKVTIVVDMEHGEANELSRLKRALERIKALPEIKNVRIK